MTYRKASLGRMATFLLPSLKLKQRDDKNRTVEDRLHDFLLKNFEGYTVAGGNIFGYWKDNLGTTHYGEHKEYKVAFKGKERIGIQFKVPEKKKDVSVGQTTVEKTVSKYETPKLFECETRVK